VYTKKEVYFTTVRIFSSELGLYASRKEYTLPQKKYNNNKADRGLQLKVGDISLTSEQL
jgi:hypothetical protein